MAAISTPDVAWFDSLYARLNRRELIHPDPLEFVYHYEDRRDRELAGLVAACLAYGNVKYILRSVARVLEPLGERPAEYVQGLDDAVLLRMYDGFKHRWTTAEELYRLLKGVRDVCREKGSLQSLFLERYDSAHASVLPALSAWVLSLRRGDASSNSLLPDPAGGSACKRYHMYLRWMVRKDAVDPGVWEGVSPSKLVVPLDVHMHRACFRLGLTKRKQASLISALEVTEAFRLIYPSDPCKYDFAITRLGIRDDMDADIILRETSE